MPRIVRFQDGAELYGNEEWDEEQEALWDKTRDRAYEMFPDVPPQHPASWEYADEEEG